MINKKLVRPRIMSDAFSRNMSDKGAISKKDLIAYFKSIEDEGFIIDRDLTGQGIARKFGIPLMSAKLLVDQYLRGELT